MENRTNIFPSYLSDSYLNPIEEFELNYITNRLEAFNNIETFNNFSIFSYYYPLLITKAPKTYFLNEMGFSHDVTANILKAFSLLQKNFKNEAIDYFSQAYFQDNYHPYSWAAPLIITHLKDSVKNKDFFYYLWEKTLKQSKLHLAAMIGNIKLDSYLSDINNFDIDKPNILETTPLMYAANFNQIEILKILIAKGAAINKQGGVRLMAPIHRAIESGNLEIVKYLIEKGCDKNLCCLYGTPINLAILEKQTEIQNFLIRQGGDEQGVSNLDYQLQRIKYIDDCKGNIRKIIEKNESYNMWLYEEFIEKNGGVMKN